MNRYSCQSRALWPGLVNTASSTGPPPRCPILSTDLISGVIRRPSGRCRLCIGRNVGTPLRVCMQRVLIWRDPDGRPRYAVRFTNVLAGSFCSEREENEQPIYCAAPIAFSNGTVTRFFDVHSRIC